MPARSRTGMLMGLSLAWLLAACTSGASPSATPAAKASSTAIPTATANVAPTASPVVPPSQTPVAAAAADCPSDPKPSTLAALDIASRLACYGSTPQQFMAVVVPMRTGIIDEIPVQVPARFRQASPPEYGRLFLVDMGEDYEMGSSLGLFVADPSMDLGVNFRGVTTDPRPSGSTSTGGVMVTGHFDDPASADCRRPTGDEWPEITDEQVVEWCRGTFIVTAIQIGG